MECTAKGTINEEIKEDAYLKGLLTQAKENMALDFERRYEDRSTKRDKELKDKYEELYKTKIDECKTSIDDHTKKIEQQDVTIRNLNSEIIKIKDEIIEKDAKIGNLTEESKTKEAKIELLEETNDNNLKRFFEFYKAKTIYYFKKVIN